MHRNIQPPHLEGTAHVLLDLCNIPIKVKVIDVLNDAGRDGWEMVALTPNNAAYLIPTPAD